MAVLSKTMIAEALATVSADLVEREITWISGGESHTATVFVRPLSYASAVAGAGRSDAVAARIAASIFDDKGQPVFEPDDITGAGEHRSCLCESLTIALLNVIGEVSGLTGKKKS